ncbi:hypothetical protein [Janthinobacterium sp.]|uniref:hypothetical protein n=1 Tax=Janthinobacterium sp. TaxID=1871054 RepID=UPI0026175A33|nr:hypothetical protein [Janthinobacterium sp.]
MSENSFRQGDLVHSVSNACAVMVTDVEDSGKFSGVVVSTLPGSEMRVGETCGNLWDYEWELSGEVVISHSGIQPGDFMQVRGSSSSANPQKTIVLVTSVIDEDAFAGVVVFDANPLNIGYASQYYSPAGWERATRDVVMRNTYPDVGFILKHKVADFEVVVTAVHNVSFSGVRISGPASGLPLTGQDFHAYTVVRGM